MAGLEQAIACGNGERAARMIQEALGIESAEVANSQVIPMSWPSDRERPHYWRVVADRSAFSSLRNDQHGEALGKTVLSHHTQ